MQRTNVTAAKPTKRLAEKIIQLLMREGQSSLVNRVLGDPTLLNQLISHLRDAAQLIGGGTGMTETHEREIIRQLVAAGHEGLAKRFAKARGYGVRTTTAARPGPHWNPWPEDKSSIDEELKGLREYIGVTKRIGEPENKPHVRTMELVVRHAEKGDWKQARKAWLKLPPHLRAGMSGRLFNHYISNASV